MAPFKDLYKFVDSALKSRKYPENTGYALKAALALFENELKTEESNSLNVFKTNLEQIYRSVCSKNSSQLSANSLASYRSRVIRVLNDYEKYGVDPTKMASWIPKIKNVKKRINQPQIKVSDDERPDESNGQNFDKTYNYSFIDSGDGWHISIKSKKPITPKIKKGLIEIFEEFDVSDKEDETV